MKKHLSGIASFFISLFLTLLFLCPTLLIAAGSQELTKDKPPVYFSSEDETLSILGETVFVTKATLGEILSYPQKAVDFTLSLMPQTLHRASAFFAKRFESHFSQLVSCIADSLKSFLTIGV